MISLIIYYCYPLSALITLSTPLISRHEIPARQTAPTQTQPAQGWVGLASSNTHNLVGGLGQYRLGWVNLLGCDLHHHYPLRKVSCLFRKNAIHFNVDHFLI